MNGKETLGNISLRRALLGGSETEALTSRTDRLRRAPLGGSAENVECQHGFSGQIPSKRLSQKLRAQNCSSGLQTLGDGMRIASLAGSNTKKGTVGAGFSGQISSI